MKKTVFSLLCLGMAMGAMAQDNTNTDKHDVFRNGWFNHIDFSVTAGTSGFGFEFSAPMTDRARLRAGGVFRPLKHYSATFGMEVAQDLDKEINDERYKKLADMMNDFVGYKPKKNVEMVGDLGYNNFKMLVDIFPFKTNRHWYATVGFFYGNGTLIEAKNTPESMNTLTAVSIYNTMYKRALGNENPINVDAGGVKMDGYIAKLRKWGSRNSDANGNPITTKEEIEYTYDVVDPFMGTYKETDKVTIERGEFSEYGISIPIGKYAHDVIAQQDIYYDYSEKLYKEAEGYVGIDEGASIDFNADEYHYKKDANGRYIKKGSIRHKKGEVVHKAGEEFRMIPDADNIIKATGVANKFKPYIGIGYETTFNKDKRARVAIDAGIMFWGGHPSVDIQTPVGLDANGEMVYMSYDMSRDLTDLKKSVNDYVRSVKHYPIFPEISARFTYRLW